MEEPPDGDGHNRLLSTPVLVALIGAAATIVAAALTGFFGLAGRTEPVPTPSIVTLPANAAPAVMLDGPVTAPVGELTYFTIISANADRAVWSIGGFNNNQPIEIAPLSPSHQIQIEPTNTNRIGDTFTLVVTVSNPGGQTATATHEFEIVPADN